MTAFVHENEIYEGASAAWRQSLKLGDVVDVRCEEQIDSNENGKVVRGWKRARVISEAETVEEKA